MFIGHYGVGFALKRAETRISVGLLLFIALLPDIIWNLLVLAGVEKVRIVKGITRANPMEFVSYPFSHSILSGLILALLIFILIKMVLLRSQPHAIKAAVVAAIAVLSHYLLDVVSHIPDIPLYFGNSPKIGLGLWNNVIASYTVESLIFIAGFALYLKTNKFLSSGKRIGFILFALFLLVLNLLNLTGTVPPSTEFLALTGLLDSVVFLLLAFWLDKKPKEAAGRLNLNQ